MSIHFQKNKMQVLFHSSSLPSEMNIYMYIFLKFEFSKELVLDMKKNWEG